MNLYSESVKKVNLRTSSGVLKDISIDGKTIYTANIKLEDFKEVPNNRNLREPDPKSPCMKPMRDTLVYQDYLFRRQHSGVVIFASEVEVNPDKTISIKCTGRDGIGDGGHTRLLAEMLSDMGNTFENAEVLATIYNSSEYSDEEISKMVISNNMSSAVPIECKIDGTDLVITLKNKLPPAIFDKLEVRKNQFKTQKKENGKPYSSSDFLKIKDFAARMDLMDCFKFDCYGRNNRSFPKDSDKGALENFVEGNSGISQFIERCPEMLKLWEYTESSIGEIMDNKEFIHNLKTVHHVNFNTLPLKKLSNKKKTLFFGYPVSYGSTIYFMKLLYAGLRASYTVSDKGTVDCVVGDIFSFYDKYKYDMWRDLLIYAQAYMEENEANHENKRFTHKEDSFSRVYDSVMRYVMQEVMEQMKK